MTVRGGGDPPKPWLSCRCADWARRLGASQPMRMCASWPGSKRSTEYKVAGAISLAAMRAPPRSVIPTTSSLHRARSYQERGTTRAVDPTRPACRRARRCKGRAFGGRCAASLDIVCARRRRQSASGRKKACGAVEQKKDGLAAVGRRLGPARANKRTLALAEGQKKWPLKMALDNRSPIQGFSDACMTSPSTHADGGVREAPVHEIAVSGAPTAQRALWGFGRSRHGWGEQD
jgi:hypothetical protein